MRYPLASRSDGPTLGSTSRKVEPTAKAKQYLVSKPNACTQVGVPKPIIDRRFPGLV